MKGFVVREDIYKKMETPVAKNNPAPSVEIGFFRKGYLWVPYLGEWEFPFK